MFKHRAIAGCLPILVSISSRVAAKDGSAEALNLPSQLVDRYFDLHFHFHPTVGTADGFHQYDINLEDYSRANLDREAAALHSILPQFRAILAQKLPQPMADDLEFVQSRATQPAAVHRAEENRHPPLECRAGRGRDSSLCPRFDHRCDGYPWTLRDQGPSVLQGGPSRPVCGRIYRLLSLGTA